MNDMTPFAARLTAERAKAMLEEAGASKVAVVGRGRMLAVFFEAQQKRRVWLIRGDAFVHNFQDDVRRELLAH